MKQAKYIHTSVYLIFDLIGSMNQKSRMLQGYIQGLPSETFKGRTINE